MIGYPPSFTAQSLFNHSSSLSISGRSIDIGLETTYNVEPSAKNNTSDETAHILVNQRQP